MIGNVDGDGAVFNTHGNRTAYFDGSKIYSDEGDMIGYFEGNSLYTVFADQLATFDGAWMCRPNGEKTMRFDVENNEMAMRYGAILSLNIMFN